VGEFDIRRRAVDVRICSAEFPKRKAHFFARQGGLTEALHELAVQDAESLIWTGGGTRFRGVACR